MGSNPEYPSTDADRSERVIELFDQACALPAKEREGFLMRACGEDKELRRELESLLEHADPEMPTSAVNLVARQLANDEQQDWTGWQINHYRLLGLLGQGGMGKVYLAEDEKLKRRVAIKFLPTMFATNPNQLQRFEQEARAASALNHPNIITIHEIGQHKGAPYIAYEMIEGQTLRQRLCDGALPWQEAVAIGAQIAAALQAAHSADIIHRDIKPENVMVRVDGLVKVLDFGIAKLGTEDLETEKERASESEIASPLTSAGMILGTASYMSPEQARGESLDGRTDLFSLGLVLYKMATGTQLLAAATRADLLKSLPDQRELPPSNLKFDRMPKELRSIIRKALRHRREERYATADEMLADLKKLQHRFDSRISRRMVRLSALVALVALLAVFGAAWASVSERWEEMPLRDGSTAGVRQAIFSPDGHWLIAVGEDNCVRVWDFARRELKKELKAHNAPVVAASFAPSGKFFATASADQTVIVWDAAAFAPITTLRDHHGPVTGVAFSPDGKYLASASRIDERVVLWRVGNWEKVRDLPWDSSDWMPLLFSPREPQRLFTQGLAANVETGKMDRDWQRRQFGFQFGPGLAFSHNGSRAVVVDSPGVVHFIDTMQWKPLGSHPTHRDNGRGAAFSPDGKLVATGSEDIALWNADTQELITRWDCSTSVWSLTWSPDGRYLVSTHGDGSILLWDIIGRERAASMNQHSLAVGAVAFSPDGQRVASGSTDRSIIIWNLATGHKETVLPEHQSRITALAFGPDSKWLAAGDQSGELIRWNITERRAEWRQSGERLSGIAISPDGRLTADSLGVYESDTGRLVHEYGPRIGNVGGVSFSSDGRFLAASGVGLYLFDTQSWNLLRRQEINADTVSFAPDGKHLVTGSISGEITLWQTEPLDPIVVLGRHKARIKQVAFSPDGQFIVSAGDDKQIKLWDVSWQRFHLPGSLSRWLAQDVQIGTHADPVLAIAFSPDGQRIVSGEHDKSVRIYTRHRSLWGQPIK